ncbi:MAG TPA: hypothetical protein VM756_07585 [Burkholderiales bacterium]|jgi:hypothetical protein|nr:hypothetical protein [Burkholderiales bacterium]
MLKWLLTLFLVVLILSIAAPALRRRFPRLYASGSFWPTFAATLVASLLALGIGRLL